MSEAIKPDLVLNMKREWLAKVWNGEKIVEYREKKPYWDKRLANWVGDRCGRFVLMVWGYRKKTPAVLLQVNRVDIGPCPYKGWGGEYYRLHFGIVGYYWKDGDTFAPIINPPRMKGAATK